MTFATTCLQNGIIYLIASSTLDRAIRYNFRSFGNGLSDWSGFQSPFGTISNFIKGGQLVRNVASH